MTPSLRDKNNMTNVERLFVAHLLSDPMRRRVEAYLRCEPKLTRAKAGGRANAILRRQHVLLFIDKKVTELAEKSGHDITPERIIGELATIAYSKMDDYVTWGADGSSVIPSDELSDQQMRAIKKIKVRRRTEIRKHGGSVCHETVELELHDKIKAAALLGQDQQMFGVREATSAGSVTFVFNNINRKDVENEKLKRVEDETVEEDPLFPESHGCLN